MDETDRIVGSGDRPAQGYCATHGVLALVWGIPALTDIAPGDVPHQHKQSLQLCAEAPTYGTPSFAAFTRCIGVALARF